MEENNVPESPMQFYRSSAVGLSLTMSLNTMLESREISMEDARRILHNFDTTVESSIRRNLCTKKKYSTMEIEGKLTCYNNLEDLWRIDAVDVSSNFQNLQEDTQPKKRVRLMFTK